MKARSGSYPSKTLIEAEKFSVSVFQNVGETVLKYADLAKQGNVPVREADSFAVTAGQYGWMTKYHGKGYSAIPSVCTALKTPHNDDEKRKLYFEAFQSPQLYKTLITEANGKKTTEEGIRISLIRNLGFTDAGARVAAKTFIDNAKFLGLINDENIFNIDSEIVININAIQEGNKSRVRKNSAVVIKKEGTISKTSLQGLVKENLGQSNNTKKISVFVRGQELHCQVLEDMNQNDWDAIIKQLQNIKSFSK